MGIRKHGTRIAFLTVDWNYELVEHTLHGLKQYTEDHPDLQLCVFDCFGKDIGNDRDKSEYAIFRLPDLSRFDGLLIQGNQIVLREAREAVERIVEETGIPAVSLGCKMKGCTLVYFDNREAQYRMASHIIRDHGARRLVYLTGIMDNNCPEGHERLDGFLAACQENQVPEENIEVIRCTWRTTDGINVARLWLREKYQMPDAFVCANDEMALGLMNTLQEGGVRIPQDVLVCGFDNLSSAELSSPRLSSVHTDHGKLNSFAMEVLLDKIRGKESRDQISFGFELICSESCGCHNIPPRSLIRDLYFQQTRFLRNFYVQQDEMASDLFEAGDLPDLMQIVSRNHAVFGCENIYLCVNEYYFDNYDKSMWPDYAERFDKRMVLAGCCCEDGSEEDFVRFPTRDLLPEAVMEQERFLIFYPLHYNTYSIGYIALNGPCEAAKLNLHESIFNFLEIAIENVRKKSLLHSLNETLDNLYVHDALTGLYNRFGLTRFGSQHYDNLMASHACAQILFIDMDDMKSINDKFGHEAGDQALKSAARLLQDVVSADAFVMRYGGDEFIIIDSGWNEHLPEDIQAAAEAFNRTTRHPFKLGFSCGVIRADVTDSLQVEDCIRAADSLMYELKQKKKHPPEGDA